MAGLLRGQSREIRTPVLISELAAAATVAGVRRLSVPSWSSGPKRPHAFPGGPLGSRGSDEKGIDGFGVVVIVVIEGTQRD